MKKSTFKLPESYGVNRLVVLPCDHKTIFVFWELSEDLWLEGEKQLKLAIIQLNLEPDGQEATGISQAPMLSRIGSLYLRVPPGVWVSAEIIGTNLSSNTVFVPRPLDAKPDIVLHAYAISP